MSKQSEEFFRVMLEFLPSARDKYRDSIEKYGELLETVVIDHIFMPDIIQLISGNKNIKLLEDIFDYFEEVSNSEDENLINIFSTTVLEMLGNDKHILKRALRYMGPKTTYLQIQVDKNLGRNKNIYYEISTGQF